MHSTNELAGLPAERSRAIEVVEFVPSDQLDSIMFYLMGVLRASVENIREAT